MAEDAAREDALIHAIGGVSKCAVQGFVPRNIKSVQRAQQERVMRRLRDRSRRKVCPAGAGWSLQRLRRSCIKACLVGAREHQHRGEAVAALRKREPDRVSPMEENAAVLGVFVAHDPLPSAVAFNEPKHI